MKKLSFILGMLFIASGVCYAQTNVVNVTETGTNQKATVDQIGILNLSNVTQSNGWNTATVTQSNYKEAFSTISGVNQSGVWNIATIQQVSNGTLDTNPNVVGPLEAYVNQPGSYNEAIQVQGPTGNETYSQQGKSYAEINQGGNSNFASQHQLRYANHAVINQSGNNNSAKQAQDGELIDEEGSANNALIDQSGSYNTATQEQNGWANTAKAYQSGSGNTSTQKQNNYSWKSDAFVSQSGNYNTAAQEQTGNLNGARIEQASGSNSALQIQLSGAQNKGTDYSPVNKAEIYQLGNDANIAIQTQTNMTNLLPNEAIITQNGYGNYASQTQLNGDNYSSILQEGNYNNAVVTQTMVMP